MHPRLNKFALFIHCLYYKNLFYVLTIRLYDDYDFFTVTGFNILLALQTWCKNVEKADGQHQPTMQRMLAASSYL